MHTLQSVDFGAVHWLNGFAGRHALLDLSMIACAKYAPVLFALLLVGLWLTWRPRCQRGAFLAGASALVALGLGQLVGMAFPRQRPYEGAGAHQVRLLVPHSPDTSFPSDHATLAFAITVVLWHVDRRLGLASLVLSLWLCVARVFIGAHYPSDVLGGAILGGAVAALAWWLVRRPPVARWLERLFALLHSLRFAAAPEPAQGLASRVVKVA